MNIIQYVLITLFFIPSNSFLFSRFFTPFRIKTTQNNRSNYQKLSSSNLHKEKEKWYKWLLPKQVASRILHEHPAKPITEQMCIDKYNMGWYVVAEAKEITANKPYKITVWEKDYVIWKSSDHTYHALSDICPHKGAALSVGTIVNDRVMCPYHGYEFSHTGNLTIVPGICFQPMPQQNVPRFSVVEKQGWIYLNTFEIPWFTTQSQLDKLNKYIFVEPEANNNTMSVILLNQMFYSYPRIVSENSLDIMHIAYVHTFGNKDKPAPSYENPPKQVSPGHWRTSYLYESGKESMVSKIFKIKKIDIENEFALPHTTVARIIFGDGFINTIVTAACPINNKTTKLFVKNYRNFFRGPMFDHMFRNMMQDTLNQDKSVIESIKIENIDGKFNMRYDKLQNTYKTFYKKYVRNITTIS